MVRLWVALLAIAIIWVCGTLPWMVIGDFLCSQTPPMACPNPAAFGRKVGIVLTVDVAMIVMAVASIQQMRQKHRYRR